ncbi:MAG: hypothetical protein H6754_06745 [Candidatus Omnitrophica bacterium]|nr:hypothetical protein [Candidatus Omnitrophota bacterium]
MIHKKLSNKYNLEICNPTLAQEWHPAKNGDLKSADVTSNSGRKVWWLCRRGHEWEAIIASRNRGTGCPYCSGNKASMDNCLNALEPEIAKEWHPTLNVNLTPKDVTIGSGRKVWWKCIEGHEWLASVHYRAIRNMGCPFCASLLWVNPKVANQWHLIKNGKLTPADVKPGSNKKVWWICAKGHEWESTVSARNVGRGCPYCAGKKVNEGNCLRTTSPELANQWHPLKNGKKTPDNVTSGSAKKIWWLCKKGHEWEAQVYDRNKGKGCPYCCGQKTSIENSLAYLKPEIAKEWNQGKNGNLKPENFSLSSNKKVWWICKKGHEWIAKVYHRSTKGSGCPYCSGRKATAETCLAILNPRLAKEWHPTKNGNLTPRDVKLGTHRKVWWICKKGHEWQTAPYIRSDGSNCPHCNSMCSKLELQIFSEIKFMFGDAKLKIKIEGNEVDIYIPSLNFGIEVDGIYWHKRKYAQDKQKTHFLQDKGIKLIRLREKGLEIITENDIVHSARPSIFHLVEKIYTFLLDKMKLDSDKSLQIKEYIQKGKIANHSEFIKLWDMLPGPIFENSLFIKNPELAKEWHPTKNGKLESSDVWPSSNKRVWWICKRGHEWEASVNHRSTGTGCPYCSGNRPTLETCLANLNPRLAKEWNYAKNQNLNPSDVTLGSNKKVWWVCTRGHEWQAVVSKRSIGRGCPYCSGRRKIGTNPAHYFESLV